MDDAFKIYIERLREGAQKIKESLEPSFLEIEEPGISFTDKVNIEGETSVSDTDLFIDLNVETEATLPCSVCNKSCKFKILISHFYHAEPLDEIRGGIFNFKEILRESILLELPISFECNNGSCPERQILLKYLKKSKQEDEPQWHPFKDL